MAGVVAVQLGFGKGLEIILFDENLDAALGRSPTRGRALLAPAMPGRKIRDM
jgi:hypothetical protein